MDVPFELVYGAALVIVVLVGLWGVVVYYELFARLFGAGLSLVCGWALIMRFMPGDPLFLFGAPGVIGLAMFIASLFKGLSKLQLTAHLSVSLIIMGVSVWLFIGETGIPAAVLSVFDEFFGDVGSAWRAIVS